MWQSTARIPASLLHTILLARAAAPDHDREIRFAPKDLSADVFAERRVVDDLLADVRRAVVDVMAVGLEPP